MNKGERSTKNKAMAAYLKAKGINRDSGRCVICNKIIRNIDTLNHYRSHSFQG